MIVDWAEACNYQPKDIEVPIKSSKLKEILSPSDYAFVTKYNLDWDSCEKLLKAVHYMNLYKLEKVCFALIAAHLYTPNTPGAVEEKLKEMKIEK